VAEVAKGIGTQRQTEKTERRETYQNPSQKQGPRQPPLNRFAKRSRPLIKKPGFDQKPKSESADDTEAAEGELIKPIYEIYG